MLSRAGFQLVVLVLAFLTIRAKVRTALGNNNTLDRSAAGGTGFARTLVDAVADLKKTFAALRVHVVRDGRSAGGDRLGEHGDDRVVEFAGALAANPPGQRHGVYAGAEQRFV